ncbi:MAG: NUDIX domain-containing protein [Bacilli bacterium]|nr:NUDIX domain-containing protein [Bacilli bacterium]
MDLSVMLDGVKFNYRAGLLIINNNKLLVECNPIYDFVTIPGGRVKTLESSIDALLRELEEEMHITISKEEIQFKSVIENFFELDNKRVHELYMLYRMNIDDKDKRFKDNMINYDSENCYYKWVDIDKLEEVNLLPKPIRNICNNDNIESIIVNNL